MNDNNKQLTIRGDTNSNYGQTLNINDPSEFTDPERCVVTSLQIRDVSSDLQNTSAYAHSKSETVYYIDDPTQLYFSRDEPTPLTNLESVRHLFTELASHPTKTSRLYLPFPGKYSNGSGDLETMAIRKAIFKKLTKVNEDAASLVLRAGEAGGQRGSIGARLVDVKTTIGADFQTLKIRRPESLNTCHFDLLRLVENLIELTRTANRSLNSRETTADVRQLANLDDWHNFYKNWHTP